MTLSKKIFFSLAMILFMALLVELSAFAFLSFEAGRPFFWGGLREIQDQRTETASEMALEQKVPDEIPHPYFGYIFNYEANGVSKYAEKRGFPISQYGFIDDKLPVTKRSADKVIIAVMGGSVAGWFSLYGEQALIEELGKHEAFRGKKIELVRLAHGGYKQPQQLIILNYLLSLGAEFDYILNIDGFNELMVPWVELRPSDVFPFFPRKWHVYASLMYLDPNFLEAAWNYQSLRRKRVAAAESFSRDLLKKSFTANLLWQRLDRLLSEKVAASEKYLRKYREDRRFFAAQGPDFDYKETDKLFRGAAEQWARSSIMMDRLAKEKDIIYMHFLQPNQYLPGSKEMTPEEIKAAYRPAHEYRTAVEKGYPFLFEEAEKIKEAGVRFFDLTGIFRDNPEPVYIDVCCHFSPEGNAEMGRVIAGHLQGAAPGHNNGKTSQSGAGTER